jgi:hypothetical protein
MVGASRTGLWKIVDRTIERAGPISILKHCFTPVRYLEDRALGSDPHGFDLDGDGVGCET